MSDHSEEVYGPDRASACSPCCAPWRADSGAGPDSRLLEGAPELQKLWGTRAASCFIMRCGEYDTPEIAEGRRIVDEAERRDATRRPDSTTTKTTNVAETGTNERFTCWWCGGGDRRGALWYSSQRSPRRPVRRAGCGDASRGGRRVPRLYAGIGLAPVRSRSIRTSSVRSAHRLPRSRCR